MFEQLKEKIVKVVDRTPGMSVLFDHMDDGFFVIRLRLTIVAAGDKRVFNHETILDPDLFSRAERYGVEAEREIFDNIFKDIFLSYAMFVAHIEDAEPQNIGASLEAAHKNYVGFSDNMALALNRPMVVPAENVLVEIKKNMRLADENDNLRKVNEFLKSENEWMKEKIQRVIDKAENLGGACLMLKDVLKGKRNG